MSIDALRGFTGPSVALLAGVLFLTALFSGCLSLPLPTVTRVQAQPLPPLETIKLGDIEWVSSGTGEEVPGNLVALRDLTETAWREAGLPAEGLVPVESQDWRIAEDQLSVEIIFCSAQYWKAGRRVTSLVCLASVEDEALQWCLRVMLREKNGDMQSYSDLYDVLLRVLREVRSSWPPSE